MSRASNMALVKRAAGVKRSEHEEQVEVITWARLVAKSKPELKLLYAIPNAGKRSLAAAAWLKAEGLLVGIPDLCLPVPRGSHAALYIEMKKEGEHPNADQLLIHHALREQGNAVHVCHSGAAAISIILQYLRGAANAEAA